MAGWQKFCLDADGITRDGDEVVVAVAKERYHRVAVHETPDTYELVGVVTRPAVTESIPDVPVRAWLRNRGTQLVGFRIDARRRLVGESWVPKAGLDGNEFLLYIRRVAAECDLFELALTGRDRE